MLGEFVGKEADVLYQLKENMYLNTNSSNQCVAGRS